MSILPAELSTGMVHGRFIVAVIDGDDADQEPEVIPATGRIVFKASVGYIPVPATNEGPVTVMKGPITGVLDSEGYLSTPHPTTGEPMYRGVKLLATDDPDMAVTDWTWAADYRFESVNGVTLQIPAHSFALPGGTVVDLTTMVKVPSSPGYGLPQAEAAVLRAEAAAQVALDVKAMADAGEFDGEQGLPGNATMRVDTTVGTRVFITDGVTERMVSGDTGWRDITGLLSSNFESFPNIGRCHIKRTNNEIEASFRLTPTAVIGGTARALNPLVLGLPPGFKPSAESLYVQIASADAYHVNMVGMLNTYTGRPEILIRFPSGNWSAGELITAKAKFSTNEPWPTTLPGTPA